MGFGLWESCRVCACRSPLSSVIVYTAPRRAGSVLAFKSSWTLQERPRVEIAHRHLVIGLLEACNLSVYHPPVVVFSVYRPVIATFRYVVLTLLLPPIVRVTVWTVDSLKQFKSLARD